MRKDEFPLVLVKRERRGGGIGSGRRNENRVKGDEHQDGGRRRREDVFAAMDILKFSIIYNMIRWCLRYLLLNSLFIQDIILI